MSEIEVKHHYNHGRVFRKAAGVISILVLIWLSVYAAFFYFGVYDDIYVNKAGVSYFNVLTLNGNIFLSLGLLIGISLLNPVLWYSIFKKRLKQAIATMVLSIIVAMFFFSIVGKDIAIQLFLLSHAEKVVQRAIDWFMKIYLTPIDFTGEELYSMMPVFDFLELMRTFFLLFSIILVLSFMILRFWSTMILASKFKSEYYSGLIVSDLVKNIFSILKIVLVIILVGYALFWYPLATYD
ncbi:MAG: hypothetical protein ACUVQ0_02555, partial [Thermoproteota archaeon]